MTNRVGLLFAALSGAGAASIMGMALRALPGAATMAAENPTLLIAAPIPIGALVAVAHVYWLRRIRGGQTRTVPATDPAMRIRTLSPPSDKNGSDGDGRPKRWKPVIRN